MSVFILEAKKLPSDFKYPESFLKFVELNDISTIKPWRILGNPRSELDFFLTSIHEIYPDKPLVPFARLEDSASGDLACFDGEDSSGNPRIYFHVYGYQGQIPSWDKRYSLDSFSDWLTEAQEDSLSLYGE